MRFVGFCLTLAFAGVLVAAAPAGAAPITYTFNDQFASYDNNSDGSPASFSPGGTLSGTLTLDPAQTGNARVVDYTLSSFLPGPGSRVAEYTFGGTGQSFSFSTDVLSIVDFDPKSVLNRLRLDFSGAGAPGDDPLTLSASETYMNCNGVLFGGTPRNSCTLPNFGVGLGTGRQGSNQSTQFTVGSESVGAQVPLPPTVALLAAGLAGLAGFRLRNRG